MEGDLPLLLLMPKHTRGYRLELVSNFFHGERLASFKTRSDRAVILKSERELLMSEQESDCKRALTSTMADSLVIEIKGHVCRDQVVP